LGDRKLVSKRISANAGFDCLPPWGWLALPSRARAIHSMAPIFSIAGAPLYHPFQAKRVSMT